MKGLILKDMYLIIKTVSWMYLFPLVIIIVCGNSNVVYLVSILSLIIPIFFTFFLGNTFHSDEVSEWGRYAKALPLTANDIVLSKFVLAGILLVFGTVASLIVNVAITVIAGIDFRYTLLLIYLGVMSAIAYVSTLIPIVFKFGASKSPIVFILLITILTVLPILFSSLGIEIDLNIFTDNPLLPIIAGFFLAIVLVLCSFVYTKNIHLTSKP